MDWEKVVAATAVTGVVLAGCFEQFAHYRLTGVRSRNVSYLLAASGLFFFVLALLGTQPMQRLVDVLATADVQLACWSAGCALLLGAVGVFLYLTYLRPSRLQFEDQFVGELPRHPPDEQP